MARCHHDCAKFHTVFGDKNGLLQKSSLQVRSFRLSQNICSVGRGFILIFDFTDCRAVVQSFDQTGHRRQECVDQNTLQEKNGLMTELKRRPGTEMLTSNGQSLFDLPGELAEDVQLRAGPRFVFRCRVSSVLLHLLS